MGTTREGGIENFWPDDTSIGFYIHDRANLLELLAKCHTKWPGIGLMDIDISAHHIHTRCLGYDLHDAGDWDDFLYVTLNESGREKIKT